MRSLNNLSYQLDLNLHSFNNKQHLQVLDIKKVNNNLVIFIKKELSTGKFIINKVLLKNSWFSFFYKYFTTSTNSIFLLKPSYLKPKVVYKAYFQLLNVLQVTLQSLNFGWISQLNLIGLGYKVFFYKNFLYFRLGYCRMISVEVPFNVKFLSRRKDSIKFLSNDRALLGNFIAYLKTLRTFNFYKGKGLFELKDFSIIRLKAGKKQQMF